jgi:NtrC-family two-component system sensor histidine kinase KinB
MRLKRKLLLAQAPLVLGMIALGATAHRANTALGHSTQRILQDNYRSVRAAEQMKEYIERMDSGVMFMVAGHVEEGRLQISTFERRFEEELHAQEGNITEGGERDATVALQQAWDRYTTELRAFEALPTQTLRDTRYFAQVLASFHRVKNGADAILAINQDAMLRKSDEAERAARRYGGLLALSALCACIGAFWASSVAMSRMLRPLTVLTLSVRRFGTGDLHARARVQGGDEIATLAHEFNTMADSLQAYRASSLGELLETQQASQALLDSLDDPVLVAQSDGRITHANAAAQRLFGPRELVSEALDTLGAPPHLAGALQRVWAYIISGRGGHTPRGFDEAVRVLGSEGHDRYLLLRGMPVYTALGAVAGGTLVLQDVTRLMRVDELKNNLVATVAHEFRTPLTSLRLAVHMCAEEVAGPLTDKQADLLFAARRDCERLQGFVDELLDLSRIQAGELILRKAHVRVEDMVRQCIDSQAHAAALRHVVVASEVGPGTGGMAMDLERLTIALSNLLSNAIRHSPEAGRVTLHAMPTASGVRIEVRDQGPGVAPELRRAIFEKYTQVPGQPRGSAGLGLFIAREIVVAHGGTIGVEDGPDGGNVFWVTMPRGPA